MSQLPDETVVRISDALYAGRKIEAIRLYRQATKLGLKESKDFIEALEVRLRKNRRKSSPCRRGEQDARARW